MLEPENDAMANASAHVKMLLTLGMNGLIGVLSRRLFFN
jgi:hypothetical protein